MNIYKKQYIVNNLNFTIKYIKLHFISIHIAYGRSGQEDFGDLNGTSTSLIFIANCKLKALCALQIVNLFRHTGWP